MLLGLAARDASLSRDSSETLMHAGDIVLTVVDAMLMLIQIPMCSSPGHPVMSYTKISKQESTFVHHADPPAVPQIQLCGIRIGYCIIGVERGNIYLPLTGVCFLIMSTLPALAPLASGADLSGIISWE